MKKNKKWEENNTMANSEDENNNEVVAVPLVGNSSNKTTEVTSPTSEQPTENNDADNTSDPVGENDEPINSEDHEPDEESVDEKEESEENVDGGMNRKEKIIITIVIIILALLLAGLIITLLNGFLRGYETRNPDDSNINYSSTTDGELDTAKYLIDENTNNNASVPSEAGKDDYSHKDNKPSSANQNSKRSDDKSKPDVVASQIPSNIPQAPNTDKNDTDNSKQNSQNNTESSEPSKTESSEYSGETQITISKVNDDTGIITVNVGKEKVLVPVQTTVFNGRVTKSGVSQGKICGCDCGISVLIYYQQEDGLKETSYNGFMNKTGDSLMILVDINGENSKLLIRINGYKSL